MSAQIQTPIQAPFVRRFRVPELLGVSMPTIDRWVREGRIQPPIKIGPRAAGWPRTYIDSLINGVKND